MAVDGGPVSPVGVSLLSRVLLVKIPYLGQLKTLVLGLLVRSVQRGMSGV